MNAPLHIINRDECISLKAAGLSWDEIASNLGISRSCVRFSVLDAETKKKYRDRASERWYARQIRHAKHEKPKPRASAHMIIKIVADYYGMSADDITSHVKTRGSPKKRTIDYITPRHLAMYLCRIMNSLSCTLPRIGRQFGGRDHSTVRSAVRKIAAMMEADESFRAKVEELRAVVTGQVGNGD